MEINNYSDDKLFKECQGTLTIVPANNAETVPATQKLSFVTNEPTNEKIGAINRKNLGTNGDLQFTVVARDLVCEEAIRQKADSREIKVFKKGRTKNRLYFSCSQKHWDQLYPQIKTLCFFEHPVSCPSHIRKTILRNLKNTADSKINLVLAEKAKALLGTINKKPDADPSQVQDYSATTPAAPSVDSPKPVPRATESIGTRIRKYAAAFLSKPVNWVVNFVRQRRCLAAAHRV
jgi:hypothetical protein